MKIKDNTYYTAYAKFTVHQLENGRKVYSLYKKDPSTRSTLSNSNLHIKKKCTIIGLFRVYNNFYIRLVRYNSTISYIVV